VTYLGFAYEIAPASVELLATIEQHFGFPARVVDVLDPFTPLIRSEMLEGLGRAASSPRVDYPSNV
jgi:hypothetical protein